MKYFKILGIAALIMVLSIGFVSAAILPNATPETQGISTQTVVQCTGLVTNSEQYASQDSNQILNGAPLASGEVYGQSVYTSDLVAVNGATSLVKSMDLNTKNSVQGTDNVKTNQVLNFVGGNGGQAIGSESASIFNAGQATSSKDQFLCPFTASTTTTVPPFNENVAVGSHFDAYNIQENSQTGITSVAATGDVPSSLSYNIGASGTGSINTYMNVLAQDARGNGQVLITPAKTTTIPATKDKCGKVITPAKTVTTPAVYATEPSSDIQYSEKTSAMGNFVFSKAMGYTSQVTG